MRCFVVTIRREVEWQGVIEALDAEEALEAANRKAKFDTVINSQHAIKELCLDEDGSEIEVDVTPALWSPVQ